MREITECELEKISAGNRKTAQSMITISSLIATGTIYLLLSEELELSTYTKIGVGFIGMGLSLSLIFLGLNN